MEKVSEFNNESILEMPMPLLNNFKPPIWHTAGYVFGWEYIKKNLKKLLKLNLRMLKKK